MEPEAFPNPTIVMCAFEPDDRPYTFFTPPWQRLFMVAYAQLAYQHCRYGMAYLIGYALPKCLKIKCYNIHQLLLVLTHLPGLWKVN